MAAYPRVYDLFVQLCPVVLPVVLPVSLADPDRARDLVWDGSGVGVRDAIRAAVMLNPGIFEIATFDKGFDRIPGVERLVLS